MHCLTAVCQCGAQKHAITYFVFLNRKPSTIKSLINTILQCKKAFEHSKPFLKPTTDEFKDKKIRK